MCAFLCLDSWAQQFICEDSCDLRVRDVEKKEGLAVPCKGWWARGPGRWTVASGPKEKLPNLSLY